MQLGELQSQYQRFVDRNVELVAISVDAPAESRLMIKRLGLDFPVLSDQSQSVQKAFGVQNPDTEALALHAVFVLNRSKQVVYRKIAGRRPLSQELLDAIDYARGQYPLRDTAPERGDIPVAFPTNNFQALIEIATNAKMPANIDTQALADIVALRRDGALDDATIAYRRFVEKAKLDYTKTQMLSTAAWITQQMIALPDQAIITGRALSETLNREKKLRSEQPINHAQLKSAQRELEQLRSLIRRNAGKWQLRSAKATLRGYRELSIAAFANSDQS